MLLDIAVFALAVFFGVLLGAAIALAMVFSTVLSDG